jgi:hypothetical protein
MSKDSAMAALTGTPALPPTTSPITADVPSQPVAASDLQSTPFARMANKEAEIVRQRNELKREQALISSEKEQIQKIKQQYDEYQTTKSKDPVAALKMLGFNEADIFNYMAASQPAELSPEQRAAKAAEEATQAKLTEFEKAQASRLETQQRESDKNLIQGYRSEVSKVVKSDPEEFRYCNYFGPAADAQIYEYVKAVANTEGIAISPKQAAVEIEQYYREQDEAMDKIRRKPAPVEASKPPERSRTLSPGFPGTEQPKPTITKTRTLHNATTSTVAATRLNRNETRDQKRERLVEALRNGAKP